MSFSQWRAEEEQYSYITIIVATFARHLKLTCFVVRVSASEDCLFCALQMTTLHRHHQIKSINKFVL